MRAATRRTWRRVDQAYHQTFHHKSATPEFFEHLDTVMEKLAQILAERPIERAKIDSIANRAYQSVRRKISEIAKTVKQPRFQEVVNIQTGKTHLIPYVE